MVLWLLACVSKDVADADHDGFEIGDCNDADPSVYPGAPDRPQDGIDSDCDGEDPLHPFVGFWQASVLDVSYAGFTIFEDGTAGGDLTVGEDMSVNLNVTGTLQEFLAGVALPVEFPMAGTASPFEGPGAVTFFSQGEAYDEPVTMEVDCTMPLGEELVCQGYYLVFDLNWRVDAVFRPN